VGPHLAAALREQWRDYREQLEKCQEDFSIVNVHQLRVQTRRLMAKLVLIGYLLPESVVRKARRVLKRRLRTLGELRDTHVQIVFLDEHLHPFPGLKRFRDYLARRERHLTKPTLKKVNRFKTRKLARWVSSMRKQLEKKGHNPSVQVALARVVGRVAERAFENVVERRLAITPNDLTTIHRTRVAFKRFRYMVDCLPVDVIRPSARALERLAAYQRLMGDVQDVQVMLTRIDEFAHDHKSGRKELHPFYLYLLRRRARLVSKYLARADAVFEFWPLSPGLAHPKPNAASSPSQN
jgi:CHAD domain-containing protein